MTALADALSRLADASEQQVRLLARQEERERERERREARAYGQQRQPQRLSFVTMATAVPGLAAQFSRSVPTEFWSLDGRAAIVSCPCGATPTTELGIPRECLGLIANGGPCGRFYLYDGEVVRVAFGPKAEPATDSEEEH